MHLLILLSGFPYFGLFILKDNFFVLIFIRDKNAKKRTVQEWADFFIIFLCVGE